MRLDLLTTVLLLGAAAPAAAQALLVVDPTGGGTHTTIQAAVTAATSGDVIEVRAGFYVEDVTIRAKGLTLVSAAPARPTVLGMVTFVDLPVDELLLCSNINLAAPSQAQAGTLRPFALVVRNCAGAVRVQSSAITGAQGGATTPPLNFTPGQPGGAGAEVVQADDLAFIDCTITGGSGAPSIGVPWDGGAGGLGLQVSDGSRVLVQRCVVAGGFGQDGESGGSGGSGAHIRSASTLVIGYSAFEGQNGGSAWNLEGGSGGDGLIVDGGASVDDFGGVFRAGVQGVTWMSLGQPPRDGLPIAGTGTVNTVPPAHPSAVHAPAVVRAGLAWSFEIVAEFGERALPLAGATPTFRWLPSLRQPLLFLVDRAATTALGGWRPLPPNGRLTLPQPPATLAPNLAPRIEWLTARISPPTPRLASTRAVVILP